VLHSPHQIKNFTPEIPRMSMFSNQWHKNWYGERSNPNKKTLMYISYVLCYQRLKIDKLCYMISETTYILKIEI